MKLCKLNQEQCSNEQCQERARLSVMCRLDKKNIDLNKINYVDLSSVCGKKIVRIYEKANT